jgi:hypothetical protein
MDNDDAKHMLLDIRRRVWGHTPFTDKDTVDPRYAMAFGLIGGMCTEAIQAVQQNRPLRLNPKSTGDDDGKSADA